MNSKEEKKLKIAEEKESRKRNARGGKICTNDRRAYSKLNSSRIGPIERRQKVPSWHQHSTNRVQEKRFGGVVGKRKGQLGAVESVSSWPFAMRANQQAFGYVSQGTPAPQTPPPPLPPKLQHRLSGVTGCYSQTYCTVLFPAESLRASAALETNYFQWQTSTFL
jgi:hypothetical protein